MRSIADIRIDHQRSVTPSGVEVCTGGGIWPCDTEVILEAWSDAEGQLRFIVESYSLALQREDWWRLLARDLAMFLADAIHDLVDDWDTIGGPRLDYDAARKALAAYDEWSK